MFAKTFPSSKNRQLIQMSKTSPKGLYYVTKGVCTGTNIFACALAPASEFLIKGHSGKYILFCTCPSRQADFLKTTHFHIENGTNSPKHTNNSSNGFQII